MTISRLIRPALLVLAALAPRIAQATCPLGSIEVEALAPGDEYGAISAALGSSSGSVEICVKEYHWHWPGSPPVAPPFCAGGYYYDNVDATGREVQIYPEDPASDICIQSQSAPGTKGGPSQSCTTTFFGVPPAPYGDDTPTFLFDGSGTSSIGPFTQIYNVHGDVAIHVEDTNLTIGQHGYATGISSPGDASHVEWTALSASTDAEITLYSTSITDSAQGIFADDNAEISGATVSIVGMDRGMELLGTSTSELYDFHLAGNEEIARICDSHVADWDYFGVTGNDSTSFTWQMGIHVTDSASMDMHNGLLRDDALSWDDTKGLITVEDSATVDITSATFDDNEVLTQVLWIDSSTVNVENTTFSDSSSLLTPDLALWCASGSGSATYFNTFNYGTDFGPASLWANSSTPVTGQCNFYKHMATSPMFATRTSALSGSYYLCPNSTFGSCSAASPLIDAGSSSASTWFSSSSTFYWTTDPEGTPQDEDTSVVDIGFHSPVQIGP